MIIDRALDKSWRYIERALKMKCIGNRINICIFTIFAHNFDNKIDSHYIKVMKEKQRTSARNKGAGGIFCSFSGIHVPKWRLLLLYYQSCLMTICTPLESNPDGVQGFNC